MNSSKISKVYLSISGLVLTAVGALTTFNPVVIKAGEGIDITGNASALNDVRAFGVLLLAMAVLAFLGSVKKSIRRGAILWTSVLFLSLGLGRLLSIILDGMPSSGMVKATVIEFVLGLVGSILFFLHRQNK